MNPNARINLLLLSTVLLGGTIILSAWPLVFKKVSPATVSASVFCANLSPKLSLTGKAAYAQDLETGKVLYEKNADIQLPLASLTKLMTALVASEALGDEDIITISKDALTPEGDSGLLLGERWQVKNLIDFTLVTSSNDGAHALALATERKKNESPGMFIQRMNERARSLDMSQTFFADDTGLDISENSAGAFGSARDIGKLFAYIVKTKPRLVESTTVDRDTFKSLDNTEHRGVNTSSVISLLPGAIGSKTGFTDIAGGNLAVTFEPLPGHGVAAIILGSTREGRDIDMVTLTNAIKTSMRRSLICNTDQ